MSALEPGAGIDATGDVFPVGAHAPVEAWQLVDGAPTTAAIGLGGADGESVGVWEMTAGVMTDVEADELFVVLSGEATVEFLEPALPSLRLRPGTVARLSAGMRTRWTVTGAPLRKVYILTDAAAADDD